MLVAQLHASLAKAVHDFQDYAEFVFLPERASMFAFNVDGLADNGMVRLSSMFCRPQTLCKPHNLAPALQAIFEAHTHLVFLFPQIAFQRRLLTAAAAATAIF